VVLADEEGNRVQPSVILMRLNGEQIVGHQALEALATHPGRVVRAAKRLIGRRFGSSEVRRLSDQVGFQIVEGDFGEPLVRIDGRVYRLAEVSGIILKRMKEIAEAATGETVDRAVITVPAYFNDRQRQETRDAATQAGLECLRILNEPTAAALVYGSTETLTQNIAVYDLGGGTFDISLLKVGDGVCEVIATAGDTFLGGEDFDRAIAEAVLADLQADGASLVEDERALLVLQAAAEALKIQLSTDFSASVEVPGLGRTPEGELRPITVTIARRRYEEVVEPLIQRTFQVCDQTLRDAALTAIQIDQVLLVGGMSHDFSVKKAVEVYFSKRAHADHNPDEVVALGAAIQAWTLTDTIAPEDMTLLLDVTSRSLGVETRGGFIDALVRRNTKLPCSAAKTFHTVNDNQERVRISIFQGEGTRREENEFMGAFVLGGLREAPAGDVAVRVVFEIDADGIVHVSAEDVESGERNEMELLVTREPQR
jgi:molecular chaperone DnaK